jgi:DNA polymerase III delta subunit
MVKTENPVYLFLGQDSFSKDKVLNSLKERSLQRATQDFNYDVLHGQDRDLTLKNVQEKLLFIPAGSRLRMVVLKNCQAAKDDIKDFLAGYVKNPKQDIILILDSERDDPKDAFLRGIQKYCSVVHFQQERLKTAFDLGRSIEFRRTDQSLLILHELLSNGQKPEQIMGGLRVSLAKSTSESATLKKRIKLLLACDLEIKTGRLKPAFALERLIVALCGLRNFSG